MAECAPPALGTQLAEDPEGSQSFDRGGSCGEHYQKRLKLRKNTFRAWRPAIYWLELIEIHMPIDYDDE